MFAKRITDLREGKNLYQKDIAEIFKVEQATVSNWENGKRIPDSDMLIKLANFFSVSIDYLLGNDKEETNIEKELKEKEALKKALQKSGFMSGEEDLTDEELENAMRFLVNNKEFLRSNK